MKEAPAHHGNEERVLILAPVGRDAQLAAQVLDRVPLRTCVCADLDDLHREIAAGAGAVLITDEALDLERPDAPETWPDDQPPWSDLPLVVLTGSRPPSRPRTAALRRLERRRNASFLQRPVPRLTLVSSVRAALESRRRQYVVRDLLEELQAAVRQRDEFLAMLGHELRNPMGAISNGIVLLRSELGGAEESSAFAVDLMERQVRHLSRILDDLLDVSRITRGKLELRRSDVELVRIVRDVGEAFRLQLEGRGQTLDLALPQQSVFVVADPTRVEQILWNLLSNATKHGGQGAHIRVSLVAHEGLALLQVSDDGQGMTLEFLARAFEVFAQAEVGKGGLGLGLPLSRRLAELHGGGLVGESPGRGKGSTFTLRLPLRDGVPAEPETAPSPLITPRCRVLVVEDHDDLAWGLERMLLGLGHEVRRVGTGRDAFAVAPEYRPDVVLLDIGLPDMDGVDVAQRLRTQLGNATRIAAMTGFGSPDVRRRSLEAGCDEHLTKPVSLDDLCEVLRGRSAPAP